MDETDAPSRATSPEQFLAEVEHAEPGWSEAYGGPQGVAAHVAELQAEVFRISERLAAVRVAAIRQMLTTQSGVEVAATLGVSKSAISKSLKNTPWKDATW